MKRISILLIILFIFIFTSCKNDSEDLTNTYQSEYTYSQQEEVIELFAIAISKSIEHIELRKLLKSETSKQFDFDYDVLYRFIKNTDFNIPEYGTINLETLICEKIKNNIPHSSLKTVENFKTCLNSIDNLNICIPYQYSDWNPNETIPIVAILDHEYINKNEKAKCYQDGILSFLLKKDGHPISPVLTVGYSERVDENGFIMVDPTGFVLDKDDRTLTAEDAYIIASENFKSGKLNLAKSIIEIFDDSCFVSTIKAGEHTNNSYRKEQVNFDDSACNFKSTSAISTPSITTLVPCASIAAAAYINWTDVSGETDYEIWRRMGQTGNYVLVGETTTGATSLVNEWLNNGGDGYYFKVRAKNTSTGEFSDFSPEKFLRACWRKGYATERIERIRLSSSCANSIGFLESYLELFVQTVRFNHQQLQVEYPKILLGSFSMAGWHSGIICNPQRDLFVWDMNQYSQNYYFYLWESDGGGSLTINVGAKAFIGNGNGTGFETSIGLAYSVKTLDDYVGFLDVYNHTPTLGWNPGEGLSLQPQVGSAFVVISSN
jgi:hypothetical protein